MHITILDRQTEILYNISILTETINQGYPLSFQSTMQNI